MVSVPSRVTGARTGAGQACPDSSRDASRNGKAPLEGGDDKQRLAVREPLACAQMRWGRRRSGAPCGERKEKNEDFSFARMSPSVARRCEFLGNSFVKTACGCGSLAIWVDSYRGECVYLIGFGLCSHKPGWVPILRVFKITRSGGKRG